MTESYTHFHIPRAGRHGSLLMLKDDTGWCERTREALDKGLTTWGEPLEAWERAQYERVAVDAEGYCGCNPHRKGAVWSLIMSHEVDEGVWLDRLPRMSEWEREDEEEESREQANFEDNENMRIMTEDYSYSRSVYERFAV